MAKALRSCPFSSRLCRECPIYIGRHSQICMATRYQGGTKPKPTYSNKYLNFEFPEDVSSNDVRMRDIEDREENIKEAKIVWKN